MVVYILIAILFFGLLIALHEFGHFIVAKLCGVKVNEFSIGMGPQLLHRQGGETEYSLRLLPIGGYCAMEGEEEGASADPRAFPNKPWWKRLLILLAGVTMNFLTGFVIILALLATQMQPILSPVVTGFMPESALEGGLMEGDRVRSVNGHAIYLQEDVSFFLNRSTGDTLNLVVERGGEKLELTLPRQPKTYDVNGESKLMYGVYMAREEETTPLTLLKTAWFQAVDYVRLVWISLGDLVTGAVGLREMSGPIGIMGAVGEAGQSGAAAAGVGGAMYNILSLVSFISINLAVMNLLPIPALDGGQILFMAVNGVYTGFTRRKMNPKYLGWVSMAGFACLLAFMLVVTVSDVLKWFGA